jgi:putative phosphoribosyl transferase
MFQDRTDAARKLEAGLRNRKFHKPLVLAIPRGGVVIGAILAQELDAELDVVLSRKLRAPDQPELAIGAISEDGRVFLNPRLAGLVARDEDYLHQECRHQIAEIARRGKLFRAVRSPAAVAGGSVIITDDGIATGSTMIASVQIVKAQEPREVIVAVPVAPPDRLQEVRRWCDDVVCLHSPKQFWAIGLFYNDFRQVEDDEVVDLLRAAATRSGTPTNAV